MQMSTQSIGQCATCTDKASLVTGAPVPGRCPARAGCGVAFCHAVTFCHASEAGAAAGVAHRTFDGGHGGSELAASPERCFGAVTSLV
jgi:hypothetical protein